MSDHAAQLRENDAKLQKLRGETFDLYESSFKIPAHNQALQIACKIQDTNGRFPVGYSELCQWASKAWWERELGCGIRGTLATWADCGFPTIAAKDDKYAAALMSTDASALMQGDLHAPGDAAVFMIPSGLLDADIIVLAHVDNSWQMRTHGPERTVLFFGAETLTQLLFEPLDTASMAHFNKIAATERAKERAKQGMFITITKKEMRTIDLLRNYVAGLLLATNTKSNWSYEGLRLSAAKKTRGVPPSHRLVVLGKAVRADVREGVRRYANGEAHKSPLFAFVVRGHYRNQPHGPGRSLQRVQWIEPFWKNGEDGGAVLARPVLL